MNDDECPPITDLPIDVFTDMAAVTMQEWFDGPTGNLDELNGHGLRVSWHVPMAPKPGRPDIFVGEIEVTDIYMRQEPRRIRIAVKATDI